MGHGRNGMVVKIHSGHGSTSDSPGWSMLCPHGLEMRFEQGERFFWISIFDGGCGLFHQCVNVNGGFWFRFWEFWNVRFDFSDDFLLGNNDLCCTLELFDAQFSIFIVIMMNGFLEEVIRIRNSCFFGDFLNHFHVDGLGDFEGWLHGFHGHGYSAVFAALLELDKGGMAREKRQRLFGHGIRSLQISDAFEENGKVGCGWCVFLIQIKADLKRLTCASGILLCLEKHATVEPRHIAGRVKGDGLVERCQGSLNVISSASFFTHREQDLDHFFRVFDVVKFGNHISRGLLLGRRSLWGSLNGLVLNGFNRLVNGCQSDIVQSVAFADFDRVRIVAGLHSTSPQRKPMMSPA